MNFAPRSMAEAVAEYERRWYALPHWLRRGPRIWREFIGICLAVKLAREIRRPGLVPPNG